MSIYYVSGIPYSSDELYHHGIKGQKWGERRFQNKDGTLTEAGKKRYAKIVSKHISNASSDLKPSDWPGSTYPGHGSTSYIPGSGYVKVATTNERTYNELKRASKLLRADADDYVNKQQEYNAIDGPYGNDETIRNKFENDARRRYKVDIENAKRNGADEYDILEFVRNTAYEDYIRSDHPMRKRQQAKENEAKEALRKLKDSVRQYSTSFLGAYGDLPAKSIKTGFDSNVKDLFSELVYETALSDSENRYIMNKYGTNNKNR